MFHWICPECGREIPPAVKECPACDPRAVVAQAAVSPVEPPAPPPPAPVPVVEPQPEILDPLLVLAESIREAQTKALEPPQPQIQGLPQLAAAVGLMEATPVEAEPAQQEAAIAVEEKPTVPEAVAPAAQPEPPVVAAPEIPEKPIVTPSEQAEAAVVAAQPEPVVAPVPEVVEKPVEQIAAPVEAPVVSSPEPVEAKAEAPQSVTEPPITAPASVDPAVPVPVALLAPPEPIPAPAPVEAAAAAPAPEPIAPPEMKHEADQPAPAVKEIVEPAPADNAPPSGSWLQLAPMQDYSPVANRPIQPVAPKVQILTTDAGPRITLPGPALPPKLERLHEAAPVTVIGEQPRRANRGKSGMPGWLISAMLMIGIPLAGAGLLFYFSPISHSSAEAKPLTTEPAAPAAKVEAPSHPVSQLVEVTGFRIVVDYNKKSEIHYLVVNHSAADLSDMTIFVTLRTASAKPGQPPLARFSFRAPSLGPFESKEMTSPIERLPKSATLPDWSDLRAEVQVGQ